MQCLVFIRRSLIAIVLQIEMVIIEEVESTVETDIEVRPTGNIASVTKVFFIFFLSIIQRKNAFLYGLMILLRDSRFYKL